MQSIRPRRRLVAPSRRRAIRAAFVLVAVAPLAGGTTASALTWQPLSVWHMDETSGQTMRDSSGTSPGALHNVLVNQPGKLGKAYAFNGTSSYVSVSNSARLNPGTRSVRISVSLQTQFAPSRPDWDLVRKGYSGTGGGVFKVEFQPGGQASCGFVGTTGRTEIISSGPSLANGAWHTVKCIKTSSNVTLQVDGRSFRRAVTIGSITNSSPVIIGAYPGAEFFKGVLDEAKIEVG